VKKLTNRGKQAVSLFDIVFVVVMVVVIGLIAYYVSPYYTMSKEKDKPDTISGIHK